MAGSTKSYDYVSLTQSGQQLDLILPRAKSPVDYPAWGLSQSTARSVLRLRTLDEATTRARACD